MAWPGRRRKPPPRMAKTTSARAVVLRVAFSCLQRSATALLAALSTPLPRKSSVATHRHGLPLTEDRGTRCSRGGHRCTPLFAMVPGLPAVLGGRERG